MCNNDIHIITQLKLCINFKYCIIQYAFLKLLFNKSRTKINKYIIVFNIYFHYMNVIVHIYYLFVLPKITITKIPSKDFERNIKWAYEIPKTE